MAYADPATAVENGAASSGEITAIDAFIEVFRDAVRRAGPGVTVQASGGIRTETARAYAAAGAHLIAIGELTHSVPAAPIRCDILAQPNESLRVDRRERGP